MAKPKYDYLVNENTYHILKAIYLGKTYAKAISEFTGIKEDNTLRILKQMEKMKLITKKSSEKNQYNITNYECNPSDLVSVVNQRLYSPISSNPQSSFLWKHLVMDIEHNFKKQTFDLYALLDLYELFCKSVINFAATPNANIKKNPTALDSEEAIEFLASFCEFSRIKFGNKHIYQAVSNLIFSKKVFMLYKREVAFKRFISSISKKYCKLKYNL